jgi:GDPmannose 4,6-dehydratase
MTTLIFGVNGQDGTYLRQRLLNGGVRVVGVSRSAGDVRADISRFDQVEALVREQQPDQIFHLAANSTTRHDAMMENHATISTGTLNVLEAVRRHCPTAKVFITGSGVQFLNRGRPISEHDPFEANSSYAVARIQSVYAARYFRSVGLQTYVGYLFHHESPMRKPEHVSQKIARAARHVGRGEPASIEIGDINVFKEWAFAGDIMDGVLTLMGQERVFEATIGSGTAHSIEQWLECCFSLVGVRWQNHVKLREGFVPEYARLLSDPSTIRSLGWSPRVELADLARMMVTAA